MTIPERRAGVLYRLLSWLSPNFPTGAFSYSHGLETAFAGGAVSGRESLAAWVAAIIVNGSGRMDADTLRDAYRATECDEADALAAVNRRGVAFRATAELALEAAQQGDSFVRTWRAAWGTAENALRTPSPPGRGRGEGEGGDSPGRTLAPSPQPSPPLGERGPIFCVFSGDGVCISAAFGAAAARAGIALDDALLGYLQAFAANLVAAGLRLGIVGQTDGQRILAALEPVVTRAVAAALSRDPEDFGTATLAADLASMRHETQYSRLFRS